MEIPAREMISLSYEDSEKGNTLKQYARTFFYETSGSLWEIEIKYEFTLVEKFEMPAFFFIIRIFMNFLKTLHINLFNTHNNPIRES